SDVCSSDLTLRLPCVGLENEFQPELDEPRIGSCGSAADNTKRGRPYAGVRRSELCSVKEVEELGSELKSELFVRAKTGSLKQGEVPIINAGRAKVRIG